MNTRICQLTALAAAMALAAPLAMAQETTTEELDQIEEAAAPPPVQENDYDDRMEPVDPEVDAMTQPPRQADDTDSTMASDQWSDSDDATEEDVMGEDQDPMHDPARHKEMREYQAASDPSLWGKLDVNGDGRVSPEEARADADFSAHFEMIDADSDGFVSDAEFKTHGEAEAEMEEEDER